MICFVCGRKKDDIEVVYTPIGRFEFFICKDCMKRRGKIWES